MKHFLTVVRDLEYKCVKEERKYYYDKKKDEVVEMFDYYDLDSGNFIMQEIPKVKSMPSMRFVLNVNYIADHPCVTHSDTEFLIWFARHIIKSKKQNP